MRENGLGRRGAATLARGLARNMTLERLDLGGCCNSLRWCLEESGFRSATRRKKNGGGE